MYPVSEAYKAAIMTSAVHHIRGSVRLTNGTSITVTDELIGDICRSMQCLNDSSVFGIGGVYQGQLIFSLVADSIERNSLYGAEVKFDFGLEISADTTEWVPLGVLYIAKAVRNENQINCTAYDRMSELDTDLLEASMKYNYAAGLVPYQAATVYSLVTLATGLEFEQTFDEIKAMTDVPLDLMYGVRDSAPKSLRTAVSQLAELIGGFAFINRSGKIEFRQFKSAEPVYTILPNRRFKLELAEQPFTVSGVSYTKATGEYTESVSGNSGYIVHFESNGLMANDNDSTDYEKWICSLIHDILNLTFTPGTLEYAGDPALDVGDFVNVKGEVADAGVLMLICTDEWQFRGPQVITAAGYESSQQSSSGAGNLGAGGGTSSADVSRFIRQLTITAIECDTSTGSLETDGKTIAEADFKCNGTSTDCFFSADVEISAQSAENVTAEYYIDNAVQDFSPVFTVQEGHSLQHFSYVFYGLNVGEHSAKLMLKGSCYAEKVQAVVWAQNIEAVTAQPTDASDYRYIVNENDVTIIGYLGSSKRPKVPDTIEGKPVAKIECTAFNYSDVKSAVITEGVTAVY